MHSLLGLTPYRVTKELEKKPAIVLIFFKRDLALLVALLVESLKETKEKIEDHFAKECFLSPRNSSTDVSSFLSIP